MSCHKAVSLSWWPCHPAVIVSYAVCLAQCHRHVQALFHLGIRALCFDANGTPFCRMRSRGASRAAHTDDLALKASNMLRQAACAATEMQHHVGYTTCSIKQTKMHTQGTVQGANDIVNATTKWEPRTSSCMHLSCPVACWKLPWAAGSPCCLCTHIGLHCLLQVNNVDLSFQRTAAWACNTD